MNQTKNYHEILCNDKDEPKMILGQRQSKKYILVGDVSYFTFPTRYIKMCDSKCYFRKDIRWNTDSGLEVMMDRLDKIYPYFRPLIGELLKLNADKEKDEDDLEEEVEAVRKYLCEILGEENLETYFGKKLYGELLVKNDPTAPWNSPDWNSDSPDRSRGKDLSPALKASRMEKKETGVAWVLKSSGANLEGISIQHTGIQDRDAREGFLNLLNRLQFSDEVKNIFMANGNCRFNALKEPEDFMDAIYDRPGSQRKIIEEFAEESWQVKFDELKELISLWKKRKTEPKEEVDFRRYQETVHLFLNLIPVTYEDDILKTEWEYQEEQKLIKRELHNYYLRHAWIWTDPRVEEFVEKLKVIMNLIDGEGFDKTQKEFWLEKFASYVAANSRRCDDIIKDIQTFQEKYSGKKMSEGDFELCQYLWENL